MPDALTVARLVFVLAHEIALAGRLFDMITLAASCRLSPTSTAAVFGCTATEVTPKSGLLPVSTGTSQAVPNKTAPSARRLRKYMTLSRVRFGNPTGVARAWRAVASWLCVAGFH